MFYPIFFSLLAVVLTLIFLNKYVFKQSEKRKAVLDKIVRVTAIVWMALYFFRNFLPDLLAICYEEEELATVSYGWLTILRWFNDVAFLLVPCVVFFDKKHLNRVAGLFVVPVAVLNACFYNSFAPTFADGRGLNTLHFFGPETQAFFTNATFRGILFGTVLLVEIAVLTYKLIDRLPSFVFTSIRDGLITLATLVTLIITIMPISAPQHVFGYTSLVFKPYGIYHLLWAVEIAVEIVVVTLIHKNRSYEDKYVMLLVLTLTLILQYHEMFNMVGEINAQRYPLQLCNIGGALILITLLTKNERLYHFCIVSNVFGAILAICLLNVDNVGIGQAWNWHYIMEHQNVICVPVLMMTLKMFKPLQKKDVKDVLVAFACYFAVVLVCGIVFNGIYSKTGDSYWSCNYFFMFDVEKATEFLPFTEKLFLVETGIFGSAHYKFKLIQPVMAVAFFAMFTGVFFAMYGFERKRRKTELLAQGE